MILCIIISLCIKSLCIYKILKQNFCFTTIQLLKNYFVNLTQKIETSMKTFLAFED